jgi:hypothetical protein
VSGLQDDDEACRFRFVGPQRREGRITPTGKAYDFPGSNFRFHLFDRLEDVKAAVIDKECMIPKDAMQLRNRRMIVGKNLSLELAQGLFHLCRIQLHDYSCFAAGRSECALYVVMKVGEEPLAKRAFSWFLSPLPGDNPPNWQQPVPPNARNRLHAVWIPRELNAFVLSLGGS